MDYQQQKPRLVLTKDTVKNWGHGLDPDNWHPENILIDYQAKDLLIIQLPSGIVAVKIADQLVFQSYLELAAPTES